MKYSIFSIQLGDVKTAQICFTKAVTIAENDKQNFLAEESINKYA